MQSPKLSGKGEGELMASSVYNKQKRQGEGGAHSEWHPGPVKPSDKGKGGAHLAAGELRGSMRETYMSGDSELLRGADVAALWY